MGEREPKIQSQVVEHFDIKRYMGTVSEPTFDGGFQGRLSEYIVDVARRHPSHPELHEHEVSEEVKLVAMYENLILQRFAGQYNIIDYFDLGSEFLSNDEVTENEQAYNTAWINFVTALELEPRSRVRSVLLQ